MSEDNRPLKRKDRKLIRQMKRTRHTSVQAAQATELANSVAPGMVFQGQYPASATGDTALVSERGRHILNRLLEATRRQVKIQLLRELFLELSRVSGFRRVRAWTGRNVPRAGRAVAGAAVVVGRAARRLAPRRRRFGARRRAGFAVVARVRSAWDRRGRTTTVVGNRAAPATPATRTRKPAAVRDTPAAPATPATRTRKPSGERTTRPRAPRAARPGPGSSI
jgi:hypothetical protein